MTNRKSGWHRESRRHADAYYKGRKGKRLARMRFLGQGEKKSLITPEEHRKNVDLPMDKKRKQREQERIEKSSTLLSSTVKSVAIGAGIGATATVFPAIVPIYKAYNIARIGKGIYTAYDKAKNKDNVFDRVTKESANYSISEVSEKISENKASQIAKDIRLASESAGLISQISKETKVDPDVYGLMLEGSIKNGLLSGIGNFTSYMVEGLVS